MATVGGMAANNAHGMRAVKYGPTGAWVLGLEVVLPNGEVIETGVVGSRAKQSSSGLELTKLFVGAEGILGVMTKLRLKLMPIPVAKAIVLAVFDVLENAGQAVQPRQFFSSRSTAIRQACAGTRRRSARSSAR
jgi:glycolate oxidase